MDLDEFLEVFDPEAGKAGRALVVDAIDGQAPGFRVHFQSHIRQPILILTEHRRDPGDREDSAWRRRDQAASGRSRGCHDQGSNASSLWAGAILLGITVNIICEIFINGGGDAAAILGFVLLPIIYLIASTIGYILQRRRLVAQMKNTQSGPKQKARGI